MGKLDRREEEAITMKGSPRIVEPQHNNSTRSPQHSIDKRGIFLRKMNATWKWPLTLQLCMFNDVGQLSELCWSGVYATQEANLNNRTRQKKNRQLQVNYYP